MTAGLLGGTYNGQRENGSNISEAHELITPFCGNSKQRYQGDIAVQQYTPPVMSMARIGRKKTT